jgi:hypothetical protein
MWILLKQIAMSILNSDPSGYPGTGRENMVDQ